MSESLEPFPVMVTCTNCNKSVKTETKSYPGLVAWVFGTCLCFVGNYYFLIDVLKTIF